MKEIGYMFEREDGVLLFRPATEEQKSHRGTSHYILLNEREDKVVGVVNAVGADEALKHFRFLLSDYQIKGHAVYLRIKD